MVAWGILPSEIDTHYSWQDVLLEILLLVGLFLGRQFCRWALSALGLFASIGSFSLQTGSVEFVATVWSLLALFVTSLLLLPSVRRYFQGDSDHSSVGVRV